MTTTRVVASPRPGAHLINHYYEDLNGEHRPHRTDGPASLGFYPNESVDKLGTRWNEHGTTYRLDGPAFTLSDGFLRWAAGGIQVAGLPEYRGDHP